MSEANKASEAYQAQQGLRLTVGQFVKRHFDQV